MKGGKTMNSYEKMQSISKLEYDKNIAYLLDENLFAPTEYKVMQTQTELLIKCMKLRYNGEIQLFYLAEGYKSLNSMMNTLTEDAFINIVSSLLSSINDVRNNGFLSIDNIDVSFDSIFVDAKTYKVKLVYLPIYNNEPQNFERTLISSMKESLKKSPLGKSSRINTIIKNWENDSLSFDHLSIRLKENKPLHQDIKKTKKQLKIVAIDAPAYFEIIINKDEFIIGKNKELADGAIPYNRKISRIHCKISTENNHYSIMDLDSLNGTYLNNIRLQTQRPVIIKNGDNIRLANSEFKVVIE